MKCEVVYGGRKCSRNRNAAWKIQVGTRESDAQLSCPQHLSYACAAMANAEDRKNVKLTLTPI